MLIGIAVELHKLWPYDRVVSLYSGNPEQGLVFMYYFETLQNWTTLLCSEPDLFMLTFRNVLVAGPLSLQYEVVCKMT